MSSMTSPNRTAGSGNMRSPSSNHKGSDHHANHNDEKDHEQAHKPKLIRENFKETKALLDAKKAENKEVALLAASSEAGPPPDMRKRQLIFDSLAKIIGRNFGKGSQRAGVAGETRGTYVFSWGAGYHGQLGRKHLRGKKKYATVPRLVHLESAVRHVACGGLHTAAVTDRGTLYTWGDARDHQLGYEPHGFTNQPFPMMVGVLQGPMFITQVACGQTHTVALTEKGLLISWGLLKYGEGGHGDRQPVRKPKVIKMDDPSIRFIDVSCGDKHTIALTSKGLVYAFGCAQQGQLGLGEEEPEDKWSPQLVESLSGQVVTSVVCGSIHSTAVTETGDLYCWGFGEHLYPKEGQNFYHYPLRIPFKERVVQVACGTSHIVALTDKGDVYTWGSADRGQLGHGIEGPSGSCNTPRLVLHKKSIAQVSAGRYHTVALTSFGVLYSWGCGESGQLGHHSDKNIPIPRVVEPNIGTVVGMVQCGEHHTVALTSTPWTKIDPELEEFIQAEREEFNRKMAFVEKHKHALFRKDLLRIEEEMATLRAEWREGKTMIQRSIDTELRHDVESIKDRERIVTELDHEREIKEGRADVLTLGMSTRLDDQHKDGHDDDINRSRTSQSSVYRRPITRFVRRDSIDSQSSIPGGSISRTVSAGGIRAASAPPKPPANAFQRSTRELEDAGLIPPNTAPPAIATSGRKAFTLTIIDSTNKDNSNNNSGGTRDLPSGMIASGSMTARIPTRPKSGTTTPGGNDDETSVYHALGSMTDRSNGGSHSAHGDRPESARAAGVARASFLRKSGGLVKDMKNTLSSTSEEAQNSQLRRMLTLVFNKRREYDSLRCFTATKSKELMRMKSNNKSKTKSEAALGVKERGGKERAESLDMKVNTVLIKLAETEENKESYKLIMTHLKEEELDRFYQLEALRRQCAEQDALCRKMNDLKLQYIEDKNRAEGEFDNFQGEIKTYRGFVNNQLGKIRSISATARARQLVRDEEKNQRSRKFHEKIATRVEKLNREMDAKTVEAKDMAIGLESVNERLRYFEKRFQLIASATGLTNPDAIITKYTLKEEIRGELNSEISKKQEIIRQRNAALSEHNAELRSLKATYSDSRWKDVDALQDQFHDLEGRVVKGHRDAQRSTEKLAFVQEGIMTLYNSIPFATADDHDDDQAELMHPERALELLVKLENRMNLLTEELTRAHRVAHDRDRENDAAAHQARQARAEQHARQLQVDRNVNTIFNLTRRISTGPATHVTSPPTSSSTISASGRGTRGSGGATGGSSGGTPAAGSGASAAYNSRRPVNNIAEGNSESDMDDMPSDPHDDEHRIPRRR